MLRERGWRFPPRWSETTVKGKLRCPGLRGLPVPSRSHRRPSGVCPQEGGSMVTFQALWHGLTAATRAGATQGTG